MWWTEGRKEGEGGKDGGKVVKGRKEGEGRKDGGEGGR